MTTNTIHFSWTPATRPESTHGLLMPGYIPFNPSNPAVDFYSFSYLYLKTWLCAPNTYFSHIFNLCLDCPVEECLESVKVEK